MMNYYELISAIKDMDAKKILFENLNENFSENYKAIHANNTTRKQAQKSYFSSKNIHTDKDVSGLFTDGVSILNLPSEKNEHGTKCNIKDRAMEAIKDKRPSGLCYDYIECSIAVAKSLGWKPKDGKYVIEINGAWYDMTLVYKLYSCIADKECCEVYQKQITPSCTYLLLRTKYGLAIILPLNVKDGGDKNYDCSFKHFVEVSKNIDFN